MAGQDDTSRSADLFSRCEPARGNSPLELLKLAAHAIHCFDALCPLERQALIGVNDKHTDTGSGSGNFLNQRLWCERLLAGGNPDRAFDPGAGGALNIVEYLAAAAAIATHHVAVPAGPQLIKVLAGHHASVADQDHAFDPEALL